MNKKVLVCGATGFMGRNIAEYFAKLDGFQVYATGLKRTLKGWPSDRFYKADLTNREQVKTHFLKRELIY